MNATQDLSEVDKLLSGFFKSEMPDPFPTLKRAMPVVETPNAREARSASTKSRFALAASVAILVGGCWYLSGQMGVSTERPHIGKGDGSAKMPKELKKATEDASKAMMP